MGSSQSEAFKEVSDISKKLKNEELNKTIKPLRVKCPAIRKELKNYSDNTTLIDAISTLDGLISLPIIVSIFKELKEKYYEKIAAEYHSITKLYLSEVVNSKIKLSKKEEKLNLTESDKLYFLIDHDLEAYFKKEYLKKIINKEEIQVSDESIKKFFTDTIQLVLQNIFVGFPKENTEAEKIKFEEDKKKFIELLITGMFLKNAVMVYEKADYFALLSPLRDMLTLGKFLWSETAESIEKPLNSLAYSAKLSKIIDDSTNNVAAENSILDLWNEAGVWLSGLHEHTYRALSFAKDGKGEIKKTQGKKGLQYTMIPNDDADAMLNSLKAPLTKYAIARFYRYVAENIFTLLKPFKEKIPKYQAAKEPSSEIDYENILRSVTKEKGKALVTLEVPLELVETIVGMTKDRIINKKKRLDVDDKFAVTILGPLIYEKNDALKLLGLLNYIKRYNLTPAQRSQLDEIPEQCDSYLIEGYKARGENEWLYRYFKAQTHTKDADQARQDITVNQKNNLEDQLETICRLWLKLNSTSSQNFKPPMESLLLYVFKVLAEQPVAEIVNRYKIGNMK